MSSTTARPSSDWDGETTTEATSGDESDAREGSETPSEAEVGGDDSAGRSISIPDDATDEEVAAIVAAVQSHLEREERATEEPEDATGDPWNLSARMLEVGHPADGIPPYVPVDSWTAASRMH